MKKLIFLMLLAADLWAAKPIQIVTTSLSQGQTGVAYSVNLVAKFGSKPYSWSIASGALPNGLAISTLSNGQGQISGTPTLAGTFNFVAQVSGGTTDTQSLYIIIAGAAPPPTPVSITTTTLPNGIVGGAYSTTLAAANGTPPYTWSTPACASNLTACLAPNITLAAATGIASGTPVNAGTWSPIIRVTDSTGGYADKGFTQIIAPAVAPTYLFSDGFESGNFAAWDQVTGTYATVQSLVKHSGTYAAQFRYVICGDSTNSACGAAHQDRNVQAIKTFTPGLPHFFLRTYVYLKTPEAGATVNGVQRKLWYLWADPSNPGNLWSCFLKGEITGSNNVPLYFAVQSTPLGGSSFQVSLNTTLNFNTWYSLEIEIQDSTVLVAPFDGIVRFWVDGVLKYESTAFSLNRGQNYPLRAFYVGQQADRTNYDPVDEYRYWDDIVIATSGPIGP